MARVKMLTLAAGPDGSMHPGKSYDVSEGLARAFVEGGAAILLDIPPAIVEHAVAGPDEHAVETPAETAVVSPPERSVGAPQRGRGKRAPGQG